jgi:anhydro-N-acetylmuramic acid kinase
MSKSLKVLGIMSGTSLDGVDFVKIKVHKKNLKCEFVAMQSFKFPLLLRNRLLLAAQNEKKISQISNLNHDLGRFYGECFKKLKKNVRTIDLIGLHGQTVFHEGQKSTLQIGEPSYIAAVSGVPVVSNFRAADIAVGGHGAPLAPFFHQVVFGQNKKRISVHNLGGISNLSLIINGKIKLGFDTGPANMLIDEEIRNFSRGQQNYDLNGNMASRGKVSAVLLAQMLSHPFFALKPPKSCGREQFGKIFLEKYSKQIADLKIEDRLATLTELTVISIAKSYQNFCKPMPTEIIFSGGGAKNKYLIKRLQDEISNANVQTIDQLGWPSESIEGAAFALLAACRYWKIPANLPIVTGAKKKVLLGQITEL